MGFTKQLNAFILILSASPGKIQFLLDIHKAILQHKVSLEGYKSIYVQLSYCFTISYISSYQATSSNSTMDSNTSRNNQVVEAKPNEIDFNSLPCSKSDDSKVRTL